MGLAIDPGCRLTAQPLAPGSGERQRDVWMRVGRAWTCLLSESEARPVRVGWAGRCLRSESDAGPSR
jgi:hypothetical protein